MIAREFLTIAAGNLWRMRLRSALTTGGVVIGIAALVTMLSFAFGVQRNVTAQFHSLGLLHTLHVTAPHADSLGAGGDSLAAGGDRRGAGGDSLAPVILDDAMIERLAALPEVVLVYPQMSFDARLEWRDRTREVTAQALPTSFAAQRSLGEMIAGRFFASDSAHEVVLGEALLRRMEIEPDSILGDTLLLRVAGRAQLAQAFLGRWLADSGLPEETRGRLLTFTEGILTRLGRNQVRLRVCGIARVERGFGFQLQQVVVPTGVAAGLDRVSFSDPLELLAMLQAPAAGGYALAVVTLTPRADQAALRDSIEALGLRTFSFAGQLQEMRKGFLVFDLIVGVIGVIALLVASLGIVNTLLMSILERTREIGILKSLGAEDGQIRLLFLIESSLIGLLGGCGGLILGWLLSRIGSLIVRRVLAAQEAPEIEMFHIPAEAALGAIAFGVLVSLLAGLYPAARAAHTDPVRALRRE